MAEVQWIKLYIDMFDKRKISKIRRLPEGDKILLFWVMLLATAGKCNAGGMIFITERVPFTKEDLADEFDFEASTIELALKAFVEYDMIDLYDDGFISVRNWEEYQNEDKLAEIREKNRLRQAKFKEKQKLLAGNVTETLPITLGNAIEEEKEIEKEKEFHSFVPSAQNANDFFREKVVEGGFELGTEEADAYMEQLKADMKLRYQGGTLGQGILFMSDNQFDDLCERLSLDELHKYIDIVVECEKNGKRYKKKSHYQAILDMANKDRRTTH